MTLNGIVTQVSEIAFVLSEKYTVMYDSSTIAYEDIKALQGKEVVVEVLKGHDDNHFIAVKANAILTVVNIEQSDLPTSLRPKQIELFSEVSLDFSRVAEDVVTGVVYCVDQKSVTSMKSNYIEFVLQDKKCRNVTARIFTSEEMPSMVGGLVTVAMLRKNGWFNIESVALYKSIKMEDPMVRVALDYIKAEIDAGYFVVVKQSYKACLESMSREVILKCANAINFAKTVYLSMDFNLKKVVEAVVLSTAEGYETEFKKVNKNTLGKEALMIANLISLKMFDAEFFEFISRDLGEKYTIEKLVFTNCMEMSEKITEMQTVFDIKKVEV